MSEKSTPPPKPPRPSRPNPKVQPPAGPSKIQPPAGPKTTDGATSFITRGPLLGGGCAVIALALAAVPVLLAVVLAVAVITGGA